MLLLQQLDLPTSSSCAQQQPLRGFEVFYCITQRHHHVLTSLDTARIFRAHKFVNTVRMFRAFNLCSLGKLCEEYKIQGIFFAIFRFEMVSSAVKRCMRAELRTNRYHAMLHRYVLLRGRGRNCGFIRSVEAFYDRLHNERNAYSFSDRYATEKRAVRDLMALFREIKEARERDDAVAGMTEMGELEQTCITWEESERHSTLLDETMDTTIPEVGDDESDDERSGDDAESEDKDGGHCDESGEKGDGDVVGVLEQEEDSDDEDGKMEDGDEEMDGDDGDDEDEDDDEGEDGDERDEENEGKEEKKEDEREEYNPTRRHTEIGISKVFF